MNETLSLSQVVAELTSRDGLNELFGILLATLIAVIAGRYASAAFGNARRLPTRAIAAAGARTCSRSPR